MTAAPKYRVVAAGVKRARHACEASAEASDRMLERLLGGPVM
jgi:hypothetical protein